MVKLGLAYDLLRLDEKMLVESAKSKGIRLELIEVKSKAVKLWKGRNDGEENLDCDIFLQRCTSYFRTLHLTKVLELFGRRVINNSEATTICGNKLFTTVALSRAGIPTPKSVMAFSKESALKALEMVGYPAVLKPVVGSWGRLIAPLNDPESAQATFEAREYMHPLYQIFYVQERVIRPPRDIRAVVVGGQLVTAIYRYSPPGDWMTNVARGGKAVPCQDLEELEEVSIKAAEAVDGEVVGVDCMESKMGLLVHEVNSTVEFKAAAKVTGVDVAGAIIDYAVRSVKR